MLCNPSSLSKQLVAAAGIIRNACVHARKYAGTLQGHDATASFLTVVRHALHDRWKRNGPSETVRNGAAIDRAIDDDGLPARPALPWLPIPRGLGHIVRASSCLPQVRRLLHDNSGRASGSRPGAATGRGDWRSPLRTSPLPARIVYSYGHIGHARVV